VPNVALRLQTLHGQPVNGGQAVSDAENDTFNTGMLNPRPVSMNRNSLQTGGNAALDLRWSRDLALRRRRTEKGPVFSMAVDACNIANRTSYISYGGNVQSSFYEQSTAALPARRLQFTARIKF
jgi:hypothetical protein